MTLAKDNISFEMYLNKLLEISSCNPFEINYQLELIKPFLESVLCNYQVVDTSRNSERKSKNPVHDRYSYTLKNAAAPDLIIAENFDYYKRTKKLKIYAAIEVKDQASNEMLDRVLYSEKEGTKLYKIHIVNEISGYLCVNDKAIATNCRRWQFFDGSKIKESERVYLKEYLDLTKNIFLESSGYFDKNKKAVIEEYFKIINNNEALKKCNFCDSDKKSEKTYFESIGKFELKTRKIINKCIVNTIDVLDNKGTISLDKYQYTPKEWDELIGYLNEFLEK